MIAVAFTQLKKRLAQLIEQAAEEPIVITRADGRDLVLMPKAEYEAMRETLHLISSKANERALGRSIAQIRRRETVKVRID